MGYLKRISALCGILFLSCSMTQAKSLEEMFPLIEFDGLTQEQQDWLALQKGLDYQTGTITLPGSQAVLELGDAYYYLSPEDTKYVLEELWGNPPRDLSLGMVFPAEDLPLEWDAWGMLLNYDPIGFVSDEDAASYNYDELLSDMQKDTLAANKEREELGYGTVDLVGWAEPPHYDAESKKLYWARELSFDGVEDHTVNYDIRALGRKGVLVMSVIGSMDQIDSIKAAAPDLIAMTHFTVGQRYVDFDPSLDTVAAIGIGGLIAGKVAAKAGFLAVALVFLKKGWVLLFIGFAALKNKIFKRKSS